MADAIQNTPAESDGLDRETESVADDNHNYGDDFDVFADVDLAPPEPKSDVVPDVVKPDETATLTPEDSAAIAAKAAEDEKPAIPEDTQKVIDGLNAALAAEREKKRDAQDKLIDIKASQVSPKAQPEERADDFNWDNPQESLARVKTELRQENQTNMINMSEAQARGRHEDYDTKYAAFVEMAKANPSLVQTMLTSADPAEYVYQAAGKQISMDEIGSDPAAYKARLRAEILAEQATDKTETLIKKVTTPLPPSANAIKGKIAQDNAPVIHDDPLGVMWNDSDR